MYRFTLYAIPLLLILLAVFGFVVDAFDLEPQGGGVVKLTLFGAKHLPTQVVFGAWLLEAVGLLALYLLIQGRAGFWWLDGLVTGWIAWVFRGPLLVITIVTAAGQRQDPWWTIAFGWWVLYSICGLSLAILARRSWLRPATRAAARPESRATVDGTDTRPVVTSDPGERPEPLPSVSETEEESPDAGSPVAVEAAPPAEIPSSVESRGERDEPEPPEPNRAV